MANAIPFPADFTLTAVIELNSNFTTPSAVGTLTQAFVETGSADPLIFASLLDASLPNAVRYMTAKAQTDISGDSGVLITVFHAGNPPLNFTCSILLLQKGAQRYQNPRRFS